MEGTLSLGKIIALFGALVVLAHIFNANCNQGPGKSTCP